MCDIFEHMLAKIDLSTSYVDDVIIDITSDQKQVPCICKYVYTKDGI
jgi:hypothetical protein